jgi:acetylornithine deacetylase/succinyl-diaminopimelate desuccinylase-like protein
MAALLEEAGLANVHIDTVGNVVAQRPGTEELPPLVVSAHLDTVFPEGTDVTVHRQGDLLVGPGIADDARGLASLLTLARVLDRQGVTTRAPLVFAATVGEEGIGDLRGVKHLFGPAGSCRAAAGFISLDGAGLDRIVVNGLGSRRYRINASGPGGHSWVDWGTANPIHTLMALGTRLTALELSIEPRLTLTVARIGGGKSINAIPQQAWLEIDTRCAREEPLDELEVRIRREVERTSESDDLTLEVDIIGKRPAGAADPKALLIRAAVEATRALGRHPVMALSSTDANVPMEQGMPALTIGCGGEAGLAHTTDEWYRNVRGPDGVVRALYTVLLTVGVVKS